MLEKYYAWHKAHREEIDVASVMVVLATIIYLVVFGVNWVLVSVLSFTGLKFLVFAIVSFAFGNTAYAFYEGREVWEKMEEKDKEEDDGSRLL